MGGTLRRPPWFVTAETTPSDASKDFYVDLAQPAPCKVCALAHADRVSSVVLLIAHPCFWLQS